MVLTKCSFNQIQITNAQLGSVSIGFLFNLICFGCLYLCLTIQSFYPAEQCFPIFIVKNHFYFFRLRCKRIKWYSLHIQQTINQSLFSTQRMNFRQRHTGNFLTYQTVNENQISILHIILFGIIIDKSNDCCQGQTDCQNNQKIQSRFNKR